MVASLPDSDCESIFESCASTAPPLSSHGFHVYGSDSSSNLSCSFSSNDSISTGGSATQRSSSERSCISMSRSNSKPHKAHDTAWTAIRGLQSREGSVELAHFKLLQQVGHGDIGNVYLVQLRGTSCIFAMKVMDKGALIQRNKLQRMHNEREILEHLDHPFLPTLYTNFDTDQFSCLVMEFCPGGDLHSLRQRQRDKRFGVKAARFYVAEVLVALQYLHMMGVVYRDLKPENVLVREDGHIMLTDFDLSLKCEVSPKVLEHPCHSSRKRLGRYPTFKPESSCSLPSCVSPCSVHPMMSCIPLIRSRRRPSSPTKRPNDTCNSKPNPRPQHKAPSFPELVAEPTYNRCMSFVGTHEYLAPEIIAGFGHGSAVDWWTLGIFLYELLFGRTPFKGSRNDSTLTNIIKQPLQFPEGADLEVGEAARNLIQGLLVKDPKKRLGSVRGAAEIKQHPFFRGVNWALIRSTAPPEVPKFSCRQAPASAVKNTCDNTNQTSKGAATTDSNNQQKKKKIWIINKSVPDSSLPDFEYF
eukprot:c34321_g1_i1 orf=577-2160(-)